MLAVATLSIFPSLAHATSGGTGTVGDPYILTALDSYLDATGSYYANTATLLDCGNIQFRAGSTVGDVHLVLNQSGTVLKAGSIRVGYPAGFTNYADISNGATLRATGSFTFGFYGRGEVTLHDGGNAICDAGTSMVGYNTGAIGNVRVNSGSTLTFTGSITAGYSAGSVGNITVDGSSSQMVCGSAGNLILGRDPASGATPAGTGTITLQNGGRLNTACSQVSIGYGGTGTLLMSSGAVWTNASSTYVSWGATATGTLSLTGSGTRFSTTGSLNVARDAGVGTVTISDSALVEAGASSYPISTGANGIIQLNGGYLAIKSASQLSAASVASTYNLKVYSGGSYVAASVANIATRYFDATTPWSSNPLHAIYSAIDLTGYTLVYEQASSAPTVTTPTSASVTAATATLGGNVTSDGGQIVTARGVVYAPTATNNNPQLGGTGVGNAVGTGTTGVFTVDVTGLAPNTAYTYAAYATNAAGTHYSATGTFTTSAAAAGVTNVTSSTTNGTYKAGSTVSIQVSFIGNVTVGGSGMPTLTLETGATDRAASYASGSGTSTLTFTYIVQAGDTSSDLDYVSTGALTLNGGTIKDAFNLDAPLTLPVPGAAGSLGANKALVIDTTAPTTAVTSVGFWADTGISATDFITKTAAQTIIGMLSAIPQPGEVVEVSLDNGVTWTTATTTGGTNVWSLSGQILTTSNTLKVRVTDSAGNSSAEFSQAYVFDTTAPTVTFSALAFSNDTGGSATDLVTKTAAQTITATLSTAPSGTDIVYGSLNNGATWINITSKVSGTSLSWDGVTLAASDTLLLKVSDVAGNDGAATSQAYSLDTVAPVITSAATDSGTYGTAYSYTIAATGGATGFGATGLPSGLSVSGSTISGIPTQTGPFSVSLSVTDAAGNTANTLLALAIAKRTVTPAVTASDKIYDGTDAATIVSRSLTGAVGSDDVSLNGGIGTFDSKDKGVGRTVTVSGLSLAGTKADNYQLSAATATTTASISAKALTVSGLSVTGKVYDGTNTLTLTGTAALQATEAAGTGTTSDGKPYAVDAVVVTDTASGTFASKGVAGNAAVTISGLNLTGTGSGNYTVTAPSSLTASITARPLTVSGITAGNKVYDAAVTATLNTSGATLAGNVSGDDVTLSTALAAGSFADSDVGAGKTVSISGLAINGTDAVNYSLTQPTTTASITPASTSISLSNLNQVYDGTPKTVTASATPSVPVTLSYNGSSTAPVNAGSYAVTATASGNYNGTASGTLTVAKASQSVTFPTAAANASIVLNASANTGLPITYSVVSGSGTISGSTLTITGSDNVTVRATQAGNNNYQPATANQTFAGLSLKAQTIDFAAIGDCMLGSGPISLAATATSGLPVTFAVDSGLAMLNGSSLALTGTGTVVVRASQPGNATYAAAPEVTRSFQVVINTPRIYFGDCRGNSTGLKVGDVAAYLPPTGNAGTLLLVIPGYSINSAFHFQLGSGGMFTVAITLTTTASNDGTEPAKAAATRDVTVRGTLVGSTLSGTVDELGLQFTAPVTPAAGPSSSIAGYYESANLNTNVGSAASIVSAQGQVLVVASTSTIATGGLGTVDASGSFNVKAANATISGAVDAPTTTVSGTINVSGGATVPFSGLNAATQRNDRMINLSSRVRVGQGDRVLISGFVISGASPKQILLRAVGPGLTGFGIQGTLANPRIRLYGADGKVVAENDDWGSAATAPTVAGAATRVGAFSLKDGSGDAALLLTLQPGAYSAQVFDGGDTGIALSEVYDASANPQTEYQQLVNISTRGESGPGENVLIGGFIVVGNAPKKVLVRGIGPALTGFGVASALSDPRLRVFRGTELIGENDNWSAVATDAVRVAEAAAKTGAFTLPNGSKDAAIVLTLAPGTYTAQVGGNGTDTGVALVEIYEIPE